jgi:hypothetical protein
LEGDVAQAMRKTNNAFCAILDFPENLIKELEKKRKLFQLLSLTPCASYADIISALERIPPRTKEIYKAEGDFLMMSEWARGL